MAEAPVKKDGSLATRIDRSSRFPVYQQIYDSLRGRIVSGQLAPGTALPNQETFSKQFGVNHITLRQALKKLQDGGFIIRKRGTGSFVLPSSEWKLAARPKRLGILIQARQMNELKGSYMERTYQELCVHALSNGTEVFSLSYGDNDLLSRLMEHGIDAVISFPCSAGRETQLLEQMDIPKVILELEIRQPGLDNIVIDCHQGVYDGIIELTRLGHRRICYVAGLVGATREGKLRTPQDSMYRLKDLRQALEDSGISHRPEDFVEIPFEQHDSDKLVTRLFGSDNPAPPTALFAFDDSMAEHLEQSLTSIGLSAPRDVSLMGFGNLPTRFDEGWLATVDVDWKAMTELAIQRVCERLNNGGMGGVRISVSTSFRPGASIAPPGAVPD